MNRRLFGYIFLLMGQLGFAGGCAYFSSDASVQTAVSREGGPEDAGTVAVPLFMFEKYKAGQEKEWPDSTITDRFVTGLIQLGYRVLDRARIRKTMRENGVNPVDLYSENDIQKIGMLLHADTVVLGKLTLIEKEDGATLSRELNIRGVRVLDGAVIFSLSAVDNTMYRILTGEDLVDQIIKKMMAPPSADGDMSVKPPKPPKTTISSAVAEEIDTGVADVTAGTEGEDEGSERTPPSTPDDTDDEAATAAGGADAVAPLVNEEDKLFVDDAAAGGEEDVDATKASDK